MSNYMVLFMVLGVILVILACIDPRNIYWGTQSWKYRDPEANEPSESRYGLYRVQFVLGALVAFGVSGYIWHDGEAATTDKDEMATVVQRTVDELENGSWPVPLGSETSEETVWRFEERLDAATDKVNEEAYTGFGPQRGGVEREGPDPEPPSADGTVSFTLVNEEGEHPWCLTMGELPGGSEGVEGSTGSGANFYAESRAGACAP